MTGWPWSVSPECRARLSAPSGLHLKADRPSCIGGGVPGCGCGHRRWFPSFLPVHQTDIEDIRDPDNCAEQRGGTAILATGVNAGTHSEQLSHPGLCELTGCAKASEPLVKIRHVPVGRKTLNPAHREPRWIACLNVTANSFYGMTF